MRNSSNEARGTSSVGRWPGANASPVTSPFGRLALLALLFGDRPTPLQAAGIEPATSPTETASRSALPLSYARRQRRRHCSVRSSRALSGKPPFFGAAFAPLHGPTQAVGPRSQLCCSPRLAAQQREEVYPRQAKKSPSAWRLKDFFCKSGVQD